MYTEGLTKEMVDGRTMYALAMGECFNTVKAPMPGRDHVFVINPRITHEYFYPTMDSILYNTPTHFQSINQHPPYPRMHLPRHRYPSVIGMNTLRNIGTNWYSVSTSVDEARD